MKSTIKSIARCSIFSLVCYLGYVQDIVLFRIAFILIFCVGCLAIPCLMLVVLTPDIQFRQPHFKKNRGEFLALRKWKLFCISIPFVSLNFYLANLQHPIFAAWYVMVSVTLWVLLFKLKKKSGEVENVQREN